MNDGTDRQEPTGRSAVRQYLIEPLQQLGMVRPVGVTKEAHSAQLEKLKDRLAYMDRVGLELLCDAIEANADGPQGNRWPAVVTIIKWASDIRKPPDEEHRFVVSWLQSIEGPKAMEGGYVVELRNWLRRNLRPPNSYVLDTVIKAKADENRRTQARYQEDRDAGRATEQQIGWLERYQRAQNECAALIAAKKKGEAA